MRTSPPTWYTNSLVPGRSLFTHFSRSLLTVLYILRFISFYSYSLIFGQSNGRLHKRKLFNALPDLPILGSPSSAANKDMVPKIQTNGDTVILLGRKHCGKKEKLLVSSSFSFSHMFSKTLCC